MHALESYCPQVICGLGCVLATAGFFTLDDDERLAGITGLIGFLLILISFL